MLDMKKFNILSSLGKHIEAPWSTHDMNTLSDKTKPDLSDQIFWKWLKLCPTNNLVQLKYCPTNNLVQKKNFKSFTQDKTKEEQSLWLRTLKTEHLKKISKLDQIISRTKLLVGKNY